MDSPCGQVADITINGALYDDEAAFRRTCRSK